MISKKYQYERLTLATAVHSLVLMVKMLLKAPEVILMLVASTAFTIVDMTGWFIILYGLCRVKFINESISDKASWHKLKFVSSYILLLVSLLFIYYLSVSPSLPDPAPWSSFRVVFSVLMAIAVTFYFISMSSDVYDRHNSGMSGTLSVLNDKKMVTLIVGTVLVVEFVTFLASQNTFDLVLLSMIKSLFSFLLQFIVIAHIYTPDAPKKEVFNPVTQF